MTTLEQTSIYSQETWDHEYQDLEFRLPPYQDQIRRWLTEWAPKNKAGSCFEVGCFPGQYLAVFGEMGFEVNGADLTPRVFPEMANWLDSSGYKVGQIYREDFLEFGKDKQFDLVYSIGFIEHFKNWNELIEKHLDLTKPGGTVMIATPNFSGGLQRLLHKTLDEVNYDRHFIPSMDPDLWRRIIEQRGFKVLYCGYFFEYDFWIGVQKRTLFQKLAFWTIRALKPLLARVLPKNSRFASPYCGIVAVRV